VTRWLIDTGPLVAYVDANDAAHAAVAECLGGFTGRLHTTAAVVTEAMHLVEEDADGPETLAEFLITAGTSIAGGVDARHLHDAARLMRKYRDTPMDYADATLVLLAGELSVADILTLDRRGFSTYRLPNGRAFRLLQL
jgi:predicted nucleic acid-binding protein